AFVPYEKMDAAEGRGTLPALRIRPSRQQRPLPGMRGGDSGGGDFGSQMRRRLFNLLAAVSIMLCVAILTMWVRSARTQDEIGIVGARRYSAVSLQGGLLFEV